MTCCSPPAFPDTQIYILLAISATVTSITATVSAKTGSRALLVDDVRALVSWLQLTLAASVTHLLIALVPYWITSIAGWPIFSFLDSLLHFLVIVMISGCFLLLLALMTYPNKKEPEESSEPVPLSSPPDPDSSMAAS